jgi:hypothetical protein
MTLWRTQNPEKMGKFDPRHQAQGGQHLYLIDLYANTISSVAPCVRIVVASNFKKKIKFEIKHEKI